MPLVNKYLRGKQTHPYQLHRQKQFLETTDGACVKLNNCEDPKVMHAIFSMQSILLNIMYLLIHM